MNCLKRNSSETPNTFQKQKKWWCTLLMHHTETGTYKNKMWDRKSFTFEEVWQNRYNSCSVITITAMTGAGCALRKNNNNNPNYNNGRLFWYQSLTTVGLYFRFRIRMISNLFRINALWLLSSFSKKLFSFSTFMGSCEKIRVRNDGVSATRRLPHQILSI